MKKSVRLKLILLFFMILLMPVISNAEVDENFLVPEYTEEYKQWMLLSEEEKQKVIEPQMYENISESIEDLQTYSSENYMVGANLPTSYLRPYYGNLRTQNSNLCWACSSANMFETNYFLTNKTKKLFSDLHMEYRTSKTYNSDGFNRVFNVGGNVNIALAYATNGMGIVTDGTITESNFKNKVPTAKVSDYDVVSAGKLKEYIHTYGVVPAYTFMYVGYFSNSNVYGTKDLAYYCPTKGLNPNHAITIVGWDDNYTNSAFPGLKGAYIALNSYGTTFGNNGLYYIFYEDAFVSNANFYFVTKTDDIDYTNIYQYDEYGPTAALGWGVSDGGTYAANVFTRKTSNEESLTELGIYFPSTQNLTIYINANDNNKNINQATNVFSTGTKTEGYHTIQLPKAVQLKANQFTIVVKYQGVMGTEFASTDANSWWYTASSNRGESFVSPDGRNWTDLKTVSALGDRGANACIKAFTTVLNNSSNPIYKPDYSGELINYVFDSKYYAEHNLDLYYVYGYNEAQLKNHWEKYGKAEGRAASPVFHGQYYVENNLDIKNAYGNNYVAAYNHFMTYGYKEYRRSSIEYDGDFYKNNNSDLSDMSSMELIRHYSLYGKNEFRQANTTYDIVSVLFDSSVYAKMNDDLTAKFGNNEARLKDHWLRYGIAEGRIASLVFDSSYYLLVNSDVKKAFGNDNLAAYNHFIVNGFAEKRQASPVFWISYYFENNSDIQNQYGTNYLRVLNHFQKVGKNEPRYTCHNFYVVSYRNNNADLYNAYGNRYEMYFIHYRLYGMRENRVCK